MASSIFRAPDVHQFKKGRYFNSFTRTNLGSKVVTKNDVAFGLRASVEIQPR